MSYILGIITGIALCCFIAIINHRYATDVRRTIQHIQSKTSKKGQVFEPEPEQLDRWLQDIETKNDPTV